MAPRRESDFRAPSYRCVDERALPVPGRLGQGFGAFKKSCLSEGLVPLNARTDTDPSGGSPSIALGALEREDGFADDDASPDLTMRRTLFHRPLPPYSRARIRRFLLLQNRENSDDCAANFLYTARVAQLADRVLKPKVEQFFLILAVFLAQLVDCQVT